jgi:hypothetical protein
MISDVLAYLQLDDELAALLTGGMYAETTINRQDTPDAFDANQEIRPCLLINQDTVTQQGPYQEVETGISARLYLRIFFYQRTGYDVINAAAARVRSLLHREQIGAGVWEIAWSYDVPNVRDQGLDCSLGMSVYQVTRRL